jgi:phosphatidylglycerol:prolipoprotein diacylglycerol transferase
MHAWGRIGCFFNGCCYGIESNAWYAMKFTTTDVKVLPINLWEASFLFLLSASLFFLLLKKNFQFGFPVYLITYGVWRFAIEYLRGDDRGSFVPGISPSQFWSIIMIIGGVVYLIIQLYYIKKSKQNENPVE